DYRLIYSQSGNESILLFIAEKNAILDILFPYVYLCAEKIARIYLGRNVSPIIPDFHDFENKLNIDTSAGHIIRLGIKKGNFILKFILGGDSGVGKTTLVTHFVDEKLSDDYKSTIGVSIMSKTIHFREWKTDVTLSIFDAAGQKQFAGVRQAYFTNARLGFLVYDVTDRKTFESIENWYKEAKKASSNVTLVLIGNKVDLIRERKVTKEEGKALAKKLKMQY
ncbi:MAG: GTP-binding protein, partial [archaeon]|nr:GTP-binding protein [archaeon]